MARLTQADLDARAKIRRSETLARGRVVRVNQRSANKLRIDRDTAARANQLADRASREQSRREAADERVGTTRGQRRRSLASGYVDDVSPGSGAFDPIGGTAASRGVSGGAASVGKSVMLVVAIVAGLSIMYLLVSNGGQGGTTIFSKLNAFLSAFTSNQALFTAKAPVDSGGTTQSSAPATAPVTAQLAVSPAGSVSSNGSAPIPSIV